MRFKAKIARLMVMHDFLLTKKFTLSFLKNLSSLPHSRTSLFLKLCDLDISCFSFLSVNSVCCHLLISFSVGLLPICHFFLLTVPPLPGWSHQSHFFSCHPNACGSQIWSFSPYYAPLLGLVFLTTWWIALGCALSSLISFKTELIIFFFKNYFDWIIFCHFMFEFQSLRYIWLIIVIFLFFIFQM